MKKVYGWKPTPVQKLVLQSALLPLPRARECWNRLVAGNDITPLDAGSNRLLPLVFHHLKPCLSEEDPYYALLQGTTKKCWFKNNLLLIEAWKLFEGLREEKVDITLLKGIHLAHGYYGNHSLRPMSDIDFLVSWDEAERAGRILEEKGWKIRHPLKRSVFRPHVMYKLKSIGFQNDKGLSVDMHWNLMEHRGFPGADSGFLERRVHLKIRGQYHRALCPEDLVLFLLEHHAYCKPVAPVRWIPDTVWVLRQEPELDWNRFTENAEVLDLALVVRRMLEYLHDEFGIREVLPPLNQLKKVPVSRGQRRIHRETRPPGTVLEKMAKLIARYWYKYKVYAGRQGRNPEPSGVKGFIGFLAFHWNIKRGPLFPFILFGKSAFWLFRYLFRSRRRPQK